MKKTAVHRPFIAAILLFCATSLSADWLENFDAYPNGTSVTNLPGWTVQDHGLNAATIATNRYVTSGNILMPHYNATTG